MEEKSRISISIGEILYWVFFGLLLFAKGIGLYDGQKSFKLLLAAAGICLLIKLIIEKYTITEYIRIFCVIALTAFTYFMSGEKGLLLYGLMMVGMKYVNVQRLFKIGTVVWTIAFCGLTFISLFHMQNTVYKVHAKLGLGHIFRWSLGYSHPNVLQVSYIVLALFWIYILGEQFRLKHAFLLFGGNCFIFMYSVSYTGFIIFMVLIVGRIYLMYRKHLYKWEKILLLLIFPVCVFLSLVAPVVIKGRLFDILNNALSTRMELGKWYLNSQYISLWGKKLADITTESLTMDNAYLFAFITYGAVPFSILCAAFIYMIYRYLKEDRYLETLIIISISVGGLTEPFLYNTSFKNLGFIFMGALLFKETNGKEKVIISTGKFNSFKDKTLCLFQFDLKKGLLSLIIAAAVCMAAGQMISYPEGYVVYRIDCADISEEEHFYSEDAVEYREFRKMHDFEEGDKIEYFSGNIVTMEKIRTGISSFLISFLLSYLMIGIFKERYRAFRRTKISNGSCKGMKQFIKVFLAQIFYWLYNSGILKNKIKVYSVDETIHELLNSEKSMVRFGDGELTVIRGRSLKLQQTEPEISEGLKRILSYEHENMIVTIPEIFGDMSMYRKESRQFWKEHLLIYRRLYKKYCNPNRIYYNTSFSRFYYAFEDKRRCRDWAEQLRLIWKDKDVVVVEGERTHNGVGNDLLSTAKSIERIIGPSSNAYKKSDEILICCRKYARDRIFLISLGVAAKFITEQLFLEGYRVLDIGNLDMEYEWYLHQEKGKASLPKHDIIGKKANREAGYNEYLEQIKYQIS